MAARARLATVALTLCAAAAAPTAAQETTIKGGVASSRLQTEGAAGYWDEGLVATTFGVHFRFNLGPIVFQPEGMLTTRGAGASQTPVELEQMRMEHIELAPLLVVPVRAGSFEPFAFAGPSLILESRCRYVTRQQGLRTTVDCEPRDPVFARRALDYALVAGAGVRHPLAGGRVSIEGRHTRGFRDIYRRTDGEARTRSWAVLVGYAVAWGDR